MKKQKNIMLLLFAVSFFQTAIFGCYNPIFSMYLKEFLHFTGKQTGLVSGISVLASIVSTLLIAAVTSRTKAGSRKMLIILHASAAIFAVIFSFQKHFAFVLMINFIYTFSAGPTIGLINGLIFSTLGSRRESYGRIRMGGTVGWIVIGWIFGFFYMRVIHGNDINYLSHAYYFAAALSIIVIILVSFVPKPEAEKTAMNENHIRKDNFSLSWLYDRQIRNVLIVFLLAGMIDVFYYFGAGPYFKSRGFAESDISPLMTLGQVTEIIALFFLEKIVRKIGYKRTIFIGLIAQTARYVLFAAGLPKFLLPGVILFHGFAIAFLYMTSTMMIDALVDDRIRSSVHQIISMLWIGLASFTGNLLAGFSMDFFTVAGTVNYRLFWAVPSAVTMMVMLLMLMFVKREKELSRDACFSSVNTDMNAACREKL